MVELVARRSWLADFDNDLTNGQPIPNAQVHLADFSVGQVFAKSTRLEVVLRGW